MMQFYLRWSAEVRRRTAWLLLVCLALLGALAGPFFLGRVYTADDLGAFHLPLRDFYAGQIAAGEPFDWMPSLYCGFYLTGEGQIGPYHPLHWLLYRWLPLGVAFDWEVLLSYPFLLAGTFLLLRRLVRRPDAALLGAMTFTFSGFCLLHFVHPNGIAVVAHLPWLLWAIDVVARPAWPAKTASPLGSMVNVPAGLLRSSSAILSDEQLAAQAVARQRQVWALAAIALLTGSQLLLGYPQYVWFSLLTEAAFAVWRVASLKDKAGRTFCLKLSGQLVAAKVCGLLLGAQQLLPTMDALAQSTRATADSNFANTGSLHPLNLLQLVAPYLFRTRVVGQNTHELGLYCGVVPLLLCVWLLTNRRVWGTRESLIKATLAFGSLALIFAFGEAAGLSSVQAYLPLVNRFRFPCRAIVLVQLAVAVLAAVAWMRLGQKPRRAVGENARWPRALRLTCAASIGVALVGSLLWPQFTAAPDLVWIGPALVCLAAWLVFAAAHGRRWALIGLPLLAALRGGTYGLSAAAYRDSANLKNYASIAPLLQWTAGARVVSDAPGSALRSGNRWLLAGFKLADGYAGLEPRRNLDYHAAKVRQVAGAVEKTSLGQPTLPACARARLMTQVVSGPVQRDLADLDVANAAAVEATLNLPPSEPGTVTIVADLAGSLQINTHATAEQLLVVSEGFDRGWQALVNGRPVPVLRVNGDFLGCVVPAGDHEIQLEFRPWSLRAGRLISECSLGLLLVWVLSFWAMHRARRSARVPAGQLAGLATT